MPKQTADDIRQTITDTIIESLEAGSLPAWRKPWANDPNGFGVATSLSTGEPYRGINQLLLQVLAAKRGYQSRWFGTFNQIKHAGASVRKGEKSMKVVLWKPIKRERTDENGEATEDNFLVMREFSVFGVEQTTGLDRFRVGFVRPNEAPFERYEQADRLFDAIGADIRFGGNKAFYSPGDFIQMPHRHQFDTAEAYYETLAHESVHWSESRIGFDRSQENDAYAIGELVAELGSCFLMGELGLPTTDNLDSHAAYVGHWLKAMKGGDTRFIFRAAATASKAVDFLLSHVRTPEEEPVSV